jgi:hypothetical protein
MTDPPLLLWMLYFIKGRRYFGSIFMGKGDASHEVRDDDV